MALWLYGSLFVHENGREVFYGYDHSHDDLCVSALRRHFAAIVAVIARVIKYLIRYGIDYYFEKLAQNQKHKED